MLQTWKIAEIQIEARQRKEIPPSHIQSLKLSILSKGLLHPIILTSTGYLVAGECRLRAIEELHEEAEPFFCNGEEVPQGEIPFTYLLDLSDADLAETELEENLLRAALPWLDEAAARSKIHNLRTGQNPQQTVMDTAKEIAEVKGTSVHIEREKVAKALLVNEHRNNPKVKAAKSLDQAHKAILDDMEISFKAKQLRTLISPEALHQVIHGDLFKELPQLPEGTFDLIACDPPYGIDADTMKNTSQHFYEDNQEYALKVSKFIISEGFRLTKPKALLFMFCDIDLFLGLRTYAQQQGWVTWRAPLIFSKGSVGHAPWGRSGFVRTYELLLFAVKGQRELMQPGGPDVIQIDKSNKGLQHAAEKPPSLWNHLLSRAVLPGQRVLDPCCGGGSIFDAGHKLGIPITGIELSEEYYNKALLRAHSKEKPSDETGEKSLDQLLED